ncbi:MAG: putative ABC transporter permease subunit [Planctomycetota bacterium]
MRSTSPSLPLNCDARLLSANEEARALWRVRLRVIRTLLGQTLAAGRFRLSLILGLSAMLWGGMFWIFLDGFEFIESTISNEELYHETIAAIFGMFFSALLVMLVFSSGVLMYGSLFRSAEVMHYLTLPIRTQRVFLHKFQEAALFSSWGFILLGSPMLLAYGLHCRAPWIYYALLLPFVLAFVYIPVAWGATLCLLIVRGMPQRKSLVAIGVGIGIVAVTAYVAWTLFSQSQNDLLTPVWFRETLDRFQVTQGRLLPSWWLSAGLLDAADGTGEEAIAESVLFLGLLVSNALLFREVAIWVSGRTLRPAYSALAGRARARRRPLPATIDRIVAGIMAIGPASVRLLVVKDLRLFRRDPAQWSQFLIFFGLLLLYFFNVRRFTYDVNYVVWVNVVSFLNMAVVGLLMSTFTTRFIFPLVSMEGRRFWLLGLLPVDRNTIVFSKFVFAVGASILPCCLLVLFSDIMLQVPSPLMLVHQLTCVELCFGLAGIAVGLGARLPNVREESPSRIAAGFGGTLNLVISTLYIVAVILLVAPPSHFYFAAQRNPMVEILGYEARLRWWLELWLLGGALVSVFVGLTATVLPLRMGMRAFRRMEF